jgi:UDP-N-acetylglucosamine 2-epimerase (non-hydrolysing)
MKIAPIIRAIQQRQANPAIRSALRYRLVHTGQHYDARMSGDFFTQLGIPEPDVNLEVGSGTQAEQTAGIMTRYERLLLDARSDCCLVVGDVTSTMACAIAAQKLRVPVAHVEAGIRSGDWTMPEEINRLVTESRAAGRARGHLSRIDANMLLCEPRSISPIRSIANSRRAPRSRGGRSRT